MFTEKFKEKTNQDFDAYYKKYKPKLIRFLIGIGKDEDDAKDVATDAFVTSLDKIDSYDPTKAVFSTWLFTIAKRIMIQRAREKTKFTSIDVDYDEGFSIGETLSYDDTDYETGHAINYQKSKSIKTIIPTLPEKYATVLTMRHINNKSYQDIAEELGFFSVEVSENELPKLERKISYDKFRNAFRHAPRISQPYEKGNEKVVKVTFAFKFDSTTVRKENNKSVTGGFVVFDGSGELKSFEQLESFLKSYLNVQDVIRHPLNLNTVKSRIRQARLLLYKLTKDDFQKMDNLDADHIDAAAVYEGYEFENVENDDIEG